MRSSRISRTRRASGVPAEIRSRLRTVWRATASPRGGSARAQRDGTADPGHAPMCCASIRATASPRSRCCGGGAWKRRLGKAGTALNAPDRAGLCWGRSVSRIAAIPASSIAWIAAIRRLDRPGGHRCPCARAGPGSVLPSARWNASTMSPRTCRLRRAHHVRRSGDCQDYEIAARIMDCRGPRFPGNRDWRA
jgi:hypothetical protein